MFNKLANKIKGIDEFYKDLKTEQISLYQHYFNEKVNSVDIGNFEKWTDSKPRDESKLDSDSEILQDITSRAVNEGLNTNYLMVMFFQYVLADKYQRELVKNNWVKTVLYKNDKDFFPPGERTEVLLCYLYGG